MVNENEYYRQTLPHYQFNPPNPPRPPMYYDNMYNDQGYYYNQNPYINQGGYIPPPMNNNMNNAAPPANYNANNPNQSPEDNSTTRLMQQFLDQNGQVDVQKMLQTVGQFADTVQQVSPVIRQLNDLIRAFRA